MTRTLQIRAYQASDGRNYVGVQRSIDLANQKASVKYGCMIRTDSLPKDKSYEEGIKEAYVKAQRVDVLNFGLEKVVKTHSLTVTLA